MADVWPSDVFQRANQGSDESLRPFHCVLLMPFAQRRFEVLARELERIVRDYTAAVLPTIQIGEARVERLDWIDSVGAVQSQLWDRIANADLVFCDLTGQNPNVMFEAGVCAAQKRIEQVIFLRDAFYRHGYIGVGFRSHNPLVPYCHVVYLNRDGSIKLAQPDDRVPEGFVNLELRGPESIQPNAEHRFRIVLTDSDLTINVDDCHRVFAVAEMPQLLSPGLIRFQAHLAWMGIRRIRLTIAQERLPGP